MCEECEQGHTTVEAFVYDEDTVEAWRDPPARPAMEQLMERLASRELTGCAVCGGTLGDRDARLLPHPDTDPYSRALPYPGRALDQETMSLADPALEGFRDVVPAFQFQLIKPSPLALHSL